MRESRDSPRARRLGRPPKGDESVGDRRAVNISPLQLGQDVLWIHSARVKERSSPD